VLRFVYYELENPNIYKGGAMRISQARKNILRRQNAQLNKVKNAIVALLWELEKTGKTDVEVFEGRLYLHRSGKWAVKSGVYERKITNQRTEGVLMEFLKIRHDQHSIPIEYIRAFRATIFQEFMVYVNIAARRLYTESQKSK